MTELLRTEGLTKRFEGLLANDAVDFTLQSGELRCVIGPNGAGKTTFISMISGHLEPTAGVIRYRGEEVTRLPVTERARRGICRKFQTPSVFDNLAVVENLELAVLASARPPRQVAEQIEHVLGLVRLEDQAGTPARNLSHGQRQWLEIGLLLANDANLLLLDEPTAGMTAEETAATGELIRRLIGELDVAAIIIEHDINFIRSLRAPITVLHLGRVLTEGTFEQVERNPEVRDVYLGGEFVMLEVQGITAGYGPITVLRDVSLQVEPGEILGMLGRNGMGKTTLVRTLSGLIRPDAGRIIFDGRDVTALPPHERARLGMTTVVQGRGMFAKLSVRESLEMGRIASGRATRSRIDEVLDYFPRLRERLGQAAGTLSGGEQQMLAIGRGLMTDPRLMLLDEPSDGIMPVLVKQISDILLAINGNEKMTLVVVEQNVPMLFRMTDRFIILEKGQIAAEGTREQVAASEVMKEYLAI